MKVLLVGNGGREHAMAWRLAATRGVKVLVTHGNGGTDAVARAVPVAPNDLDAVVKTARSERVDLVAVGPESPLAAGLADRLHAAGLKVFGPVQAAARIESSKAFCHEVLEAAGVPCAPARVFDDARAAMAHLATCPIPAVVKADGLAAGKGVVVATTREEAIEAAKEFMVDGALGAAGRRILIEEHVVGEEASFMVLTDGEHVLPFAPAQDHKRLNDGDLGPNTGGMGAYSPTRALPPPAQKDVVERIIRPTLAELARRGIRYQGVLYAGLMVTKDRGPMVLEFNCRFGDPESQPVFARMRGNLAEVLLACAEGRLDQVKVTFDPRVAVCVVLASDGYPGRPRLGDPISGLDEAAAQQDVVVFHAGTKRRSDGAVVTSGGRVLGVTALADSVKAARERAYDAVRRIRFDGMQFRKDIGVRSL
ncbi:MAG: phosphoribosylamine--glycine ligase [Deltaproteobacteria bacterium]|nr:phosphoribosylamine--glycine ligase [Deltaproteobacteria bacterium]